MDVPADALTAAQAVRRAATQPALILRTYCPDKLQAYQDKLADLKTADTIKP